MRVDSQVVIALRPTLVVAAMAPLLCGLGVGLAAAQATHDGAAEFGYRLGSAARGDVSGTCDAAGILFPDHRPGTLRIAADGGRLELYATEWNLLRVRPDGENPTEVPLSAHQTRSEVAVAPGVVQVGWTEEGKARLVGHGWNGSADGSRSDFRVRFESAGWESSPPTRLIDMAKYYVERDGLVFERAGTVTGLNRLVRLDNGTVTGEGSLAVFLQGAWILGPDGTRWSVPVRQEETATPNPAAAPYVVRVHHAILRLTGARIEMAAPTAPIACGPLTARLDGQFLARAADGRVDLAGGHGAFQAKDLLLEGRVELNEVPRDSPERPDAGAAVSARAQGQFTQVSIDYVPLPLQDLAAPDLEAVILWTAAGAGVASALLFLGRHFLPFFTRLQRHSLADQSTRAVVQEAVRAQPWSTIAEISRASGVDRSTLRHHLRVLVRHDVVLRRKGGRSHRYALAGQVQAPPMGHDAPVGDRFRQELRELVRTHRLAMAWIVRHFVVRFGYSRPGAWKGIRRLVRSGEVELVREGRDVWVQTPGTP